MTRLAKGKTPTKVFWYDHDAQSSPGSVTKSELPATSPTQGTAQGPTASPKEFVGLGSIAHADPPTTPFQQHLPAIHPNAPKRQQSAGTPGARAATSPKSPSARAASGHRTRSRPATAPSEQDVRLQQLDYLRSRQRLAEVRQQRAEAFAVKRVAPRQETEVTVPLLQPEYRRLQHAYEAYDRNGIKVGWAQLLEIGKLLDLRADPKEMIRLDRERPPLLSLTDCLQFYYPAARENVRVQTLATAQKVQVAEPSSAEWWKRYDPRVLEELISIFHLWTMDHATGECAPRLTLPALRGIVPKDTIGDEVLRDIFRQHAATQEAGLSLEEFAAAMSECYAGESDSDRPSPKLYFQ